MGKRLYVGSLPFETTDGELQTLFSACGKVESAKVISDKMSGRSKGFGFVTVTNEEMANNAVTLMNGQELGGRQIFVNIARPQEKRDNNRSGGGFGNNTNRRFNR